jgi:hypothetical protein
MSEGVRIRKRSPPPRDPQYLLVHIIEMIKAGYRSQAVAAVRIRGKSVAWAERAVEAIEWAMNERIVK